MGAIFGFVAHPDRASTRDEVERMDRALEHHGQGAGGSWFEARPTMCCGLGCRLTCFTPEDRFERLPLVSPDRQQVLVWDGRLDNREDLVRELTLIEPRTVPDSRIVLLAYRRWGTNCLHRLVGAFAFALVDLWEGSMLLARSPICAPTLYFTRSAGRFAFATVPSGLFTLPGIKRAINEPKLADMLVFSPASDPEATWYEGIQRLATGSLLRIPLDSPEHGLQEKYWDPDIEKTIRYRNDEDYLAAFRSLTDQVVKAQSRTTGSTGILLSGGLDSTAIAATASLELASGRTHGSLQAYTAVWNPLLTPLEAGRYHDETSFVVALARRHANLEIHRIDTQGQSFLDGIDTSFLYYERYFTNSSNRAWMEAGFDQARRDGVTVLLSGSQGNLAFSRAGVGILAEHRRSGNWAAGLRTTLAMAQQGQWRPLMREILGYAPDYAQTFWNRWLRRAHGNGWADLLHLRPINPEFALRHDVEARGKLADAAAKPRLPAHFAHRRLLLRALQHQDLGIFETGLRARYGVDPRAPLTDKRLVEFCLSLPEAQSTYRGMTRAMPRRALGDRVPAEILGNTRRGQQGADWFDRLTAIRDRLPDELDRLERHELVCRALDLKRMRAMINRWPEAGTDWQTLMPYYNVLEFGLVVGRFLVWFDPVGADIS